MVRPKSLFSDGVWPRIRTRLPASASRHPYTLWERELGSEACEPHSLSRPWSSSLVRPLAEPFLHPGHRHQMPSVSSGSQGWPLLRRPPEGLVLDGREHGGTLDWHGVRLDALLSAYPSITVKECPSECAPTLKEIRPPEGRLCPILSKNQHPNPRSRAECALSIAN